MNWTESVDRNNRNFSRQGSPQTESQPTLPKPLGERGGCDYRWVMSLPAIQVSQSEGETTRESMDEIVGSVSLFSAPFLLHKSHVF